MAMEKRGYKDRAPYLIKAVTLRRKRLKEKAVMYKGGKCEICGYSRDISAMEFHHIDPSTKSFGLSMRGITRSWEKVLIELDKCIMICANCHREVHSGLTQLPSENLGWKLGELRET